LPADLHRNAWLETVYRRRTYFFRLADPCAELSAEDLRTVGSETHVGRSGTEAGRDDSRIGSVIDYQWSVFGVVCLFPVEVRQTHGAQ